MLLREVETDRQTEVVILFQRSVNIVVGVVGAVVGVGLLTVANRCWSLQLAVSIGGRGVNKSTVAGIYNRQFLASPTSKARTHTTVLMSFYSNK